MKTEISRDSHQPKQRYSGVYQQQGRMLTDADWNELVEILKHRLDDALKDVVGIKQGSRGGTPRHRALQVMKAAVTDDLTIQPGHVYANGVHAEVPGDTTIAYGDQRDFPAPPAMTGDYVLYIDAWERTVTQLMDERLRDKGLHGADTCTRKQMMAQVKWCPAGVDPEQSATNPCKGDAELKLTLLHKTTEADPCDPCAAQLDVDSKIGNYLFRVEVHDVQGDANSPTEITLKWSSENGAEQFQAMPTKEEMPDGFISDKWVYEFFDSTTERHLGVHLDGTAWTPSREMLTEIKEPSKPYTLPVISGPGGTDVLIRRWDGYCRLDLSGSGSLMEGVDRGITLSTANPAVNLGDVGIGSTLQLVLESIRLELELDGKSFVAGDYWLAEVREAEHEADSVLITEEPPRGITHHYLTVGKVTGAVLEDNAESDRKYAFPALTEMTRMFMAGGDGQEVMPGQPLPQLLRVGVANGEWPVAGAAVRFEIEKGGLSLNPASGWTTNADGIAECEWTPGIAIDTDFRVKATLVNPDDPGNDFNPPVYFHANLVTADQVAYEAGCPDSGQNTVHSLLAEDLAVTLDVGTDDYYTVAQVLDAMLCQLRARHIPYDPTNGARWDDINEEDGATKPATVQQAIDALLENLHSEDITYLLPNCDPDTNTLKFYLQSEDAISHDSRDAADRFRIDALWDALLCSFKATHLPIDRASLCAKLAGLTGNEQVDTVQDAINALCNREQGGGCCEITIAPGDDLEARLTGEIAIGADAHVCISNGEYIVDHPVLLEGRGHITIEGCGDGTLIRAPESEAALILSQCKSVVVRDLAIRGNGLGDTRNTEFDHLNGALTVHNVEDVIVEHVSLSCAHGGERMASCLTVAHDDRTASVRIRACHLNPGHQQVGMLLINANRARIEDNEVKVRPKPRKRSLKKLLKNRSQRLTIRKAMLSDMVVVAAAPTGTEAGIRRMVDGRRLAGRRRNVDRKRNVAIEYEGRMLRFQTHNDLRGVWPAFIKSNPLQTELNDRDLTRHLKSVADNILLDLAGINTTGPTAGSLEFKPWFDGIKSQLPAIASQGIVCAGRVANDICITSNSIQGVSQGIHIGLSHKDPGKPASYHAGRLLVAENRIVTYLSAQVLGDRHGMFIGNFECLHVENNHLQLRRFPDTLDQSASGIRVYGHFGGMLQVRGNRLNAYNPAIFARAVNAASKESHLWQVENNLLEGAAGNDPLLDPDAKFIKSNNPH